jgi:phage portal protein BeeE
MSIFTYRKDKKELDLLRQKMDDINSFRTQSIHWDKEGNKIPLFNFSDPKKVDKAIRTVPELTAVLNYIGKSFSSGIYEEYTNDNLNENSEVVKVLNNPHTLYSGSEFLQTVGEQLFSHGVTHLYMNAPLRRENLEGIMILPTHLTKVYVGDVSLDEYLTGGEDLIKHYEVTYNNKTTTISKEEIITITLNTRVSIKNKYVHYESPLKPLENALMVTPAMYDSMQNIMNNYGMIGFISNRSSDSGSFIPIQEKEKDEIQKSINKYGTKNGQRRYGFVNYDLRYTAVSSPLKDMLLPEQQKMIKTIIADILGFDTAILNNDSANKYANYQEARKSLFSENIIPASNNYTQSLSDWIYKFKLNTYVKLDYKHLDIFSEDEKTKADKIAVESNYIINLNTAVAQGMSRDAAVELLISNGYDQETANKLIS